jgi:magnesium-transporting ATPase (P-type)
MNKLNRLSGYAAVAAKIMMVILIIAIIATAILLIVSVAYQDLLNENLFTVDLTLTEVRAVSLNAITVCIVALILLYYVARLFTNIHRDSKIFTESNVKDLRMIALLMVIAAVVIVIVTGIIYLWNPSPILDGASPLFLLMMAFFVYILSLIFSHGAELQKQSDETL